jgi:hypothetical protein
VRCRESSSTVSPLVNERRLGRTRARGHRIDSPLRGVGSVRRCVLALMLSPAVGRSLLRDRRRLTVGLLRSSVLVVSVNVVEDCDHLL